MQSNNISPQEPYVSQIGSFVHYTRASDDQASVGDIRDISTGQQLVHFPLPFEGLFCRRVVLSSPENRSFTSTFKSLSRCVMESTHSRYDTSTQSATESSPQHPVHLGDEDVYLDPMRTFIDMQYFNDPRCFDLDRWSQGIANNTVQIGMVQVAPSGSDDKVLVGLRLPDSEHFALFCAQKMRVESKALGKRYGFGSSPAPIAFMLRPIAYPVVDCVWIDSSHILFTANDAALQVGTVDKHIPAPSVVSTGDATDGHTNTQFAGWPNSVFRVNLFDTTPTNGQIQPTPSCPEKLSGTSFTRYEKVLSIVDPLFYPLVGHTKDTAFTFIHLNSKSTTAILGIRSNSPESRFIQVVPPTENVQYFLEHCEDWIYMVTNADAPNFRMLRARVDDVFKASSGSNDASFTHCVSRPSTVGTETSRCIAILSSDHPDNRDISFSSETGSPRNNVVVFPSETSSSVVLQDQWETVVPHRTDTCIMNMEMFSRHAVLFEHMDTNVPSVSVLDLKSDSQAAPQNQPNQADRLAIAHTAIVQKTVLDLPRWAQSITSVCNADPLRRSVCIAMSSPAHPGGWYEYDLESGKSSVICKFALEKKDPETSALDSVRSMFNMKSSPKRPTDASGSVSDQLWVPALRTMSGSQAPSSSTDIPLTVLRRRSRSSTNGPHPLLLIGYGAYGKNQPLMYSPEFEPLLDDGWVVAFAHVRGGAERTTRWHKDGYRLHKKNSFHDFLDCADFLCRTGWTSRGRIAACGESSGGLVAAAAAHQDSMELIHGSRTLHGVVDGSDRHIFGALILRVPYLNVLHSLLHRSDMLSIPEIEEWDDPRRSDEVMKYISSYDPVSTIPSTSTCVLKHSGRCEFRPESPSQLCDCKRWLHHHPPTLIVASHDDNRVPLDGPMQYTAQQRALYHDLKAAGSESFVQREGSASSVPQPNVFLHVRESHGHFHDLAIDDDQRTRVMEYAFITRYCNGGQRH